MWDSDSRPWLRRLILWGLVIVVALYVFLPMYRQRAPEEEMSYSEFLSAIDAGKVAEVTISDESASGTFTDGRHFRVYLPRGDTSYIERLRAHGVPIKVEPRSRSSLWSNVLTTMLPFLLLVALWMLMLRQARSGAAGYGGRLGRWRGKRIVVSFRDSGDGRPVERSGILRNADQTTLELEDAAGVWLVNLANVQSVREELPTR